MRDENLDLAREQEKLWSIKMTVIPIVTGILGTIPKGFAKGLEDLEISGDPPNRSIIKIVQNTRKSPGDLRRLTVTYSSVKPSANDGVKNSQRSNDNNSNIIIIIYIYIYWCVCVCVCVCVLSKSSLNLYCTHEVSVVRTFVAVAFPEQKPFYVRLQVSESYHLQGIASELRG